MGYGERIKHYRVLRQMSQEVFAERTGITYTSISRIEHGTRKVTLEEAVTIATVLGISLEDLAGTPACAGQQDEVKLLAQHWAQKMREAETIVHEASTVAAYLDHTLSCLS